MCFSIVHIIQDDCLGQGSVVKAVAVAVAAAALVKEACQSSLQVS